MAASYDFHPEALFEYAEATNYYLHEASARVAERFVAGVESARPWLPIRHGGAWSRSPRFGATSSADFPSSFITVGSRSTGASPFMQSCTAAGSPAIGVAASNETPD